MSGAGQAVGGAAAGVGQAAEGTLGDALPEGLASNPLDYLTDGLLRQNTPAAGYSEAALRREVSGILMSLIRTGEISETDRQYLVSAAAARTQRVAALTIERDPAVQLRGLTEAVEAVVAAVSGTDGDLTAEAADVLFHLLVLIDARGVTLADVESELDRREGRSGIDEKASRK